MPSTLRLKERDREKYLAIGESDRMTLKFMKPRASAAGDEPRRGTPPGRIAESGISRSPTPAQP